MLASMVIVARLLGLSGGTASFLKSPFRSAFFVFVGCGARRGTCHLFKKMTLCHVPWILFLEPLMRSARASVIGVEDRYYT